MASKYVVEVRDKDGKLDSKMEEILKEKYPYLFSKGSFTINELCYYASFGQGRDRAIGPMQLGSFMDEIGVTYRIKYW